MLNLQTFTFLSMFLRGRQRNSQFMAQNGTLGQLFDLCDLDHTNYSV
uniref:Uncharacterized protein n=2 Tax=Pan TaxID=9596 RepID=A0A2I3TV22_PANTR